MKTKLSPIIAISFFLFTTQQIHGQSDYPEYDSIAVSKPKKNKLQFEFSDPVLSSITIKEDKSVESPKDGAAGLKSFAGDVALFQVGSWFGSSTTSKNVICIMVGKLISNNLNLNWQVPFMCPGELQTTKEKVDGSVSTVETVDIHWKEGAICKIVENGDTIGYFQLISDPRTNPLFSDWSDIPFRQDSSRYPKPEVKKYMDYNEGDIEAYYNDYGVIGQFRKEPFVIVFNGDLGKSWFYKEDLLKMIFYNDLDDFFTSWQETVFSKKKPTPSPYIHFIQPYSIMEKFDMMRLAMASRYLTKITSKGKFY